MEFIEKEDAVYRAFLVGLHDLGQANVSDITRDTEKCCSEIFLAAQRKEITYKEATTCMAMRTNRRLIQNVRTCLDDIRRGMVKSPQQAHAYIWMILQPYVLLDDFCMMLLSPEDKAALDEIAEETPRAFETLHQVLQSDSNRLPELPGNAHGNIYRFNVKSITIHNMIMLRHFLDDFMSLVPLQLPQLLDVTTMEEPQFYGDYVLLTFPLRDPYDLEEVMDMFEDDMELITLYHHIPAGMGNFGHSTCAYSNPAFGQMFKMNAKTDTDGKVKHIVATIYDSLELMYGDLCLDLKLHSESGHFKYKKEQEDVLMDFM